MKPIPAWAKVAFGVVGSAVAIAFLVMGVVVLIDDSANRVLNREVCYGNVTHVATDSMGLCYRASVELLFGNNFPATVDFPVINWMLACESKDSVNEWLARFDGSSFDCWAAAPNYDWNHSIHGRSRAIRDQYDYGRIIGWIIMMSIGIAWFGLWCIVITCVGCAACCGGECYCI